MKSLKIVLKTAQQNFRKWQTDYRIWIIGAMMIVFVVMYLDDFAKVSNYMNTPMPIWTFPFLYTAFAPKIVLTFPIILMFCNAPFTDRNQIFMFMRTGRTKWLCGQILYIFIASAMYYILLFLMTFVFTVFSGELSLDWGITLKTITPEIVTYSGACGYLGMSVSNTVLTFFTPLGAVWFTFLMSWLAAVILGLIVFFFNFLTETKGLGLLVSTVLLAFGSVAGQYINNGLIKYSPIAWNTLNNIDVGGLTQKPSFTYCISIYGILIVLLIAGILLIGRKKDIDIKGE